MTLIEWQKRWGLPAQAMLELHGLDVPTELVMRVDRDKRDGEAAVMDAQLLACGNAGVRAWRNNVGAGKLENGNFLRWGLANETAAQNAILKSSDLIGITPTGRFWARETKRPGWVFTGTPREVAQLNFINLINILGGDAAFTTMGTDTWP
jgi:hypothetical protein